MKRFVFIVPSVEPTGVWMSFFDHCWHNVHLFEVTLNLDDLPSVMG
jgi:hypothetical protein